MFKTQKEMEQNQITMNKNTRASIKNVQMQIGQLSQQMAAQTSYSRGFIGNKLHNPKNEICKVIEFRNRVIPSEPNVSGEKKESRNVEKRSEKNGC